MRRTYGAYFLIAQIIASLNRQSLNKFLISLAVITVKRDRKVIKKYKAALEKKIWLTVILTVSYILGVAFLLSSILLSLGVSIDVVIPIILTFELPGIYGFMLAAIKLANSNF